MEFTIDKNNKKVIFDDLNVEYKIIYSMDEPCGDDSTCDRGWESYILFDKQTSKHYILTSRYEGLNTNERDIYDNDGNYIETVYDGCEYTRKYERWKLVELD